MIFLTFPFSFPFNDSNVLIFLDIFINMFYNKTLPRKNVTENASVPRLFKIKVNPYIIINQTKSPLF